MWGAVLAVEREGRGGVIVCNPALLTAGKTGPPDRLTDGHHEAAIFIWAFFFFFLLAPCAFRDAAIEPQQPAEQEK